MNPLDELEISLNDLRQQGLFRTSTVVERRRPGYVTIDGIEYVDFASNDYLGLACDRRIAESTSQWILEHGWGAAASPLITGYSEAHRRMEEDFAAFLGTESALLFESGFAANSGALPAIAGPGDVVFCDKRNHASLVDGCKLSGAKLRVYRSDRLEDLERRLLGATGFRRRWIVTDSVFSMDGDVAPLNQLSEIAGRTGAEMFVDEAHALGLIGPQGRGGCAQLSIERRPTFVMATLGKSLGGVGAVVGCSRQWRDWLVNSARTYIYSTALPSAAAVAAATALRIVCEEPERGARAMESAEKLRQALVKHGFDVGRSETAIIPIRAGSSADAMSLASRLRNDGLWAVAIRPPTVPAGSCRVRVSVSSAHFPSHFESLLCSLSSARQDGFGD